MKHFDLKLLFLVILFSLGIHQTNATDLGIGDLAITSCNTDSNDEFSFILLTDISGTTTVYFTENGWNETNGNWGNIDEGTITWTYTGTASAGTEIQITTPKTAPSATIGTATENGTYSPSSTGDVIIAYTGTGIPNNGTEVTNFIWAVNTGSAGWVANATTGTTSGIPAGLTDGATAEDFTTAHGADDNFQFDCNNGAPFATIALLRTALATGSNFINGTNSENYQAPGCTYLTPPDTTDPQVQSITRQTPTTSPTNADVLVFAVEFTETVVNVNTADFSIGSTTTATITNVVDLGSNVWGVTISGGDLASFNGTVTLGFVNNQDIEDTAGNTLTNTTPIDPFPENFLVDNIGPGITSIVRQTPMTSPTNADALAWDVTFDVDVSNVDISDFTVSGTTAAITTVTNPSGNTYRVTTSGGDLATLNGTVTLGFAGGQNISDDAGNVLTNTTPTGTNDNTFVIDNTGPTGFTVSIDQAIINVTNETGIDFTFGAAEVGATYNYLFESDGGGTDVTGSGIIATATDQITGINLSGLNDGLITLIVTLTDALGNIESVSAVDVRTKETSRPTVAITSTESPGPTGSNPIPVTITFSEDVTDFMMNEIIVSNGAPGNFSGSGTTYTVDITPMAAGAVTVDISANVAVDASGNGNTAASQFSITYDNLLNIDDEILANSLTIYPMPSYNTINISGETSLALKRADIFDIQGRLVLSQKLDANSNTNTIDISATGSGMYLMTIHSETGGSTTKRIIKQ
ncbi:Ig-like domain-containing protein [uncultured Aquimarina sp.]|uniref:Ig-like domain-containing protein n=1 Tax=uncultured Aquimarina sp. TaxID=575652 RepID=UPI00261FF506|nr:Ig-like domain-containing protein [uncultured Aquimarina sp.]